MYGSDWKAELDFLQDCFDKYADGQVGTVFEPACGTGRLLFRLAGLGFDVGGLDLNPAMVDYCNARLEKHGRPGRVTLGDMTDFRVQRPYEAAFNLINSFRHLTTEKAAIDHLRCVARALHPGGLYVLGLHLTPLDIEPLQEESWPARRGNLAVLSRLWIVSADYQRRYEEVGMSYDVYTPTKQFRIEGRSRFRTYTAAQFEKTLKSAGVFEVVATHDFGYDAGEDIEIQGETEDIVYVLRATGQRPGRL
ncbi:MAG: class I SAM-dependent methyltransferase [Planctomycetota bacterium]